MSHAGRSTVFTAFDAAALGTSFVAGSVATGAYWNHLLEHSPTSAGLIIFMGGCGTAIGSYIGKSLTEAFSGELDEDEDQGMWLKSLFLIVPLGLAGLGLTNGLLLESWHAAGQRNENVPAAPSGENQDGVPPLFRGLPGPQRFTNVLD